MLNGSMTVAGLLLAHGAGGGADQHTLVALRDGLDVPVRRMEFRYRREGRRFPDRAPKLIAEVRAEAEAFAAELGAAPARLVLGGRSMGGRMCSMAVAEGLPAAGLVLLSYPLHRPASPTSCGSTTSETSTCPRCSSTATGTPSALPRSSWPTSAPSEAR